MSKLEQLIEDLCPNGVEYKSLKECTEMKRGTSATKNKLTFGDIPVISGGKEPSFYCDTYNRTGETITVAGSGAGAGYVQYWRTPIFVNDAFSIKTIETLDTRYVYHYLLNIQDEIYATKKGGGVPHVHVSSIENFKIPLPPLQVQLEIVRILDNFTELTKELREELTMRKKQYEYYRDSLLSFGYEVAWKTLGEIFYILAGGDVPKAALSSIKTEEFSIPILSNGIDEKSLYGWTSISKIKKPSLTISARGTIGWVSYRDTPFFPIVRLLVLTPKFKLNLKYAYYFMKMIENDYKAPQTGIPQLTKPMINDIKIPLLPLEEQKRIVDILDRFDTLCNDISKGLPGEIEVRQKQYEYYRDKLLTFKNIND